MCYNLKVGWKIRQNRAFCKQSCTKISDGLDKLDPRSGERAIWELFQNARDLTKEDSQGKKRTHIKIILTSNEFTFAHQGKPFDYDSLTSLVMQVSSQSKENDETVGQYGTGFVTTHAFGRKLKLNGSLDLAPDYPGKYVDIDLFEIDRTFVSQPEFVDKVARQLINVDNYADAPRIDSCREWTELRYDLSSAEGALEKAQQAIITALDVMPYVMTINKSIGDVVIEDHIANDTYQFDKRPMPDENGLKVLCIRCSHNGSTIDKNIYYLESEDGDDIVILPLENPYKGKSLKNIAKLFVFFPLLGTENFGMDAIFHSKKFSPVESRDGIWLPVSNANVRHKYKKNVEVLESLMKMVFDYYRSHVNEIKNWVEIVGLSFDCERNKEDITNTFFRNYKQKWVEFFESLPMIDIEGERQAIRGSKVSLFSPTIVSDINEDEEKRDFRFNSLYSAASIGNVLPSAIVVMDWSNVVASWNPEHKVIRIFLIIIPCFQIGMA